MKKRSLVALALILSFCMVFAACGGDAGLGGDTTTPDPAADGSAPAATTEPTEDVTYDEPEISLVLTNHDPDESMPGAYCFAWAEMVKEKSNGRLEIQVNNNGSIAGPAESLDMLRAGTVDIALGLHHFYPDVFPMSEAYFLPMLDIGDSKARSQNLMDVFLNTDLLTEEYADFQVIMMRTSEGQPIILNKRMTTMEDLRGTKLRISYPSAIAWADKFGIQSEGVPINETYSVLQNGSFDGAMMGWTSTDSFKVYEVVDYIPMEPINTSTFFFMMNKEKYNSLPDWARQVIDDCSGWNALDILLDAWVYTVPEDVAARWEAAGVEIYELDDAVVQEMRDVAAVTNQEWIDSMEAKGFPAQLMYDTMVETAEKYK